MEDFVFKLITVEGAGTLLNLVLCSMYVQHIFRRKERKGAQTLWVSPKGGQVFQKMEEAICTEMTRKATRARWHIDCTFKAE